MSAEDCAMCGKCMASHRVGVANSTISLIESNQVNDHAEESDETFGWGLVEKPNCEASD
jgi:hypothetical protein